MESPLSFQQKWFRVINNGDVDVFAFDAYRMHLPGTRLIEALGPFIYFEH